MFEYNLPQQSIEMQPEQTSQEAEPCSTFCGVVRSHQKVKVDVDEEAYQKPLPVTLVRHVI